jgi:hypothetical protein
MSYTASAWPPDAMTFYGWGYVHGIARGRELEDAEIAFLHSWAVRSVHAAARFPEYAAQRAARQAREVASCEAQKRAAVPWPDEGPSQPLAPVRRRPRVPVEPERGASWVPG